MALPVEYNTVTVTGRYVYLDGTPVRGSLKFTGKVIAVAADSQVIIIPSPVVAHLDEGGSFTVNLPATDDPDVSPGGWTYKVEEQFVAGGGRTFEMDAPLSAGNFNISSVAPTGPGSPGDPTVFVTLTSLAGAIADAIPGAIGDATGSPNGIASLDGGGKLAQPVDAAKLTSGTLNEARLPDLSRSYASLTDRSFVALAKTLRQGRRGISVAGAEFSASNVIWEDPASFPFLASRGIRLVRLPFLWESMQPTLSGALSSSVLNGLKTTVRAADDAGVKVILDVHNYAKFNNVFYRQAGGPDQDDFIDLWQRLSDVFRDDIAVVGYGLMNEPRDIPTVGGVTGNEMWKQAQQAALNAIRAKDDSTCVLVSGYTAGAMGGWLNATSGQPLPYIKDPADNFRWEAHHYWDSNGGRYNLSYTQELANTASWGTGDTVVKKTMFELDQWIRWLKDQGQRGYIGEFGWPSSDGPFPADAAAWDNVGSLYLQRIAEEDPDLIWTTAWATGSRWSDGYELNYYTDTAGVLTTPLSNAATLEAHAERGVAGIGAGQRTPQLTIKPSDFQAGTPWVGWSFDVDSITGQAALPTGGQVVVSAIKVMDTAALSRIIVGLATAPVTPTSGQCFAALFDSTGKQLAVSADISTALTGTGFKTFSLTTTTGMIPAGTMIYGALLVNAATQAQLAKAGTPSTFLASPMNRRHGLSGSTGATAMPTSISVGGLTAGTAAFFMAVQ
jgi:aryl-phospho-beta-D-glucosidase BglC (GH1 family)